MCKILFAQIWKMSNYFTCATQHMQFYNKIYGPFLKDTKNQMRSILRDEMNLPFNRSRFKYKGYYYPLRLVLFEGPELGYFVPSKWIIGINKSLMAFPNQTLLNVLRHELAHLKAYIDFGASIADHGKEFREVCKSYGWGEDIYLRGINLEEKQREKLSIQKKIEKLLKLSTSLNIHESQTAMAKALKLMEEHQINYSKSEEAEDYLMKPILSFKRKTPKYHCISEILEHFFVFPVFNYGDGEVSLEVTGRRDAIEVAEYIAGYLNLELENIWKKAKKNYALKSKASFFYGLSEGYKTQFQEVQGKHFEIIKVQEELDIAAAHIYGSLRKKAASSHIDGTSMKMGKSIGSKLQINSAIKGKNQKFLE